jgi:hypothetical protein
MCVPPLIKNMYRIQDKKHNQLFINIFASAVLIFVPFASNVASVSAQTPTTKNPSYGQALEIAPPVISLKVNPGQVVKTQIFLRDITTGDLIVTGEANDFTASGEDGTPKILLDEDNTNSNPYSLKDWINPPATLRLIPKEVKTMSITINVPANAAPGGHYGVIRFTATPPSLKNSGVSLSTSLGALLLVSVKGPVTESLTVKEFSVSHKGKTGSIFEGGPLNFVERLQNSGNIHEQPSGQVTITNMFGKKIASVNVNLPPRNILPQSTRKFEQSLDKTVIGNKKLFGRYTAKLNISYGEGKKSVTSTLNFWVIPYKIIAILILLLIAGFFVLRAMLRRYNRIIISRAGGNGHSRSKRRRR